MVLGILPVPGRPTNLDYSRARAYCTCSRCRWGLFGHFFLSSIISHFFLPLFGLNIFYLEISTEITHCTNSNNDQNESKYLLSSSPSLWKTVRYRLKSAPKSSYSDRLHLEFSVLYFIHYVN